MFPEPVAVVVPTARAVKLHTLWRPRALDGHPVTTH